MPYAVPRKLKSLAVSGFCMSLALAPALARGDGTAKQDTPKPEAPKTEGPKAAVSWRGMSDRGDCTSNHQDHVHVSFIGPDVAPDTPAAPAPVENPASDDQ